MISRLPLSAAKGILTFVTLLALFASHQAYRAIVTQASTVETEQYRNEAVARSNAFKQWLNRQLMLEQQLLGQCSPPAKPASCLSSPSASTSADFRYAYVSTAKAPFSIVASQYPNGILSTDKPLASSLQKTIAHSLAGGLTLWGQDLVDPHAIYRIIPVQDDAVLISRVDSQQLARALGETPQAALKPRLAVETGKEQSLRFVRGDPESSAQILLQEKLDSAGHWQLYWDSPPPQNNSAGNRLAFIILIGGVTFSLLAFLSAWFALNALYLSRRQNADLQNLTDELADSERNYRLLVEQIPGVVFRSKPMESGHQLLLASPGISMLTGYGERDFLPSGNRQYMDLIHPQDRERVQALVQQHQRREGTYEIEYRLKSGRDQWIWVLECAQAREHPSGAILIDGIVFDITARKLAQHTLQESEAILHAIIDQTPNIAIQGYTIDGRIVFWNRASELLFGWSSDEAVGHRIDELLITGREMLDFLTQLALIASRKTACAPVEVHLRTKNGNKRWMLSTVFPVGNYLGEEVYVCMDVDIDDRKKIEDELRAIQQGLQHEVSASRDELHSANLELEQALKTLMHSEKLASLGGLVAGLAHELNTPLGNTLTVATTLRDSVQELDREQTAGTLRKSSLQGFMAFSVEAAELIERNARRASELISHFKIVASDTTSDRRRQFDLAQTVTEVLTTLSPLLKHQPHSVDVAIPAGMLFDSYPGALEQILTNLIQNSIRHAFPAGQAGRMTITASFSDDERVLLSYHDNGCGIPPELQQDVFAAFFTTKLAEGGSGLGLYIVKNLTENVLGGTLVLESSAENGTRFLLEIPITAPAATRNA
ncbi:PAS domain-containing sensor histidine kinase [Chitinilyticum aquatile]|uniref:PAS domain-containing sensor histidine kinase n=1 Tax=Chitinilyticum aquatile TaxID=362520 RepID=UPI00041CE635|nr:PAS domain-containing sensor histidine kinase [Chitinilyticum aquatile]